nr:Fic family protein [uncultured Anaerostipes sp.]
MCVNAMMRDKQKGYREKNVFIGTMTDAVFYPTDYKKVPELMKEISSEWNDLEGTLKEVLEKITELHFRFERIHPFEDGNGRTGRMIFNR